MNEEKPETEERSEIVSGGGIQNPPESPPLSDNKKDNENKKSDGKGNGNGNSKKNDGNKKPKDKRDGFIWS